MNIPDPTGTPIPGQTDTMDNPSPPTPTGGTSGNATYAGNTIPVDTISTGQTPPTYPTTATSPSTASNTLSSTLSQHEAGLVFKNPDPTQTPASTNSRQPILDRILAAMDSLGNKGTDTATANAQAGVAAKLQASNDLTNLYNTTKQNYANQIAALQKNPEGLFGTGLQDKVDEISRQQNRDLANIAIQQNAANGNYTTALKIATDAVNAKYEPLQAEVDNLTKYYTLTKDDMTTSEQQTAAANIKQKQDDLQFARDKELKAYEASLRAPVKTTPTEALGQYGATFIPGAKMADGTPTVYNQGGTNYINPNAFKAAITDAAQNNVTRKAFIAEFGSQLATDSKGQPLPAYGLTPTEIKLVTAAVPVPGSTVQNPPPGT